LKGYSVPAEPNYRWTEHVDPVRRGVPANLPTLPEQTKIAHFLSAIDEKISHCQVRITKMEQYKKGLLQQLFV
jgi:type I restriction enzyme S subunit